MKRKNAILLGFLGLALLDGMFAFVKPIDFTCTSLSIVWHFYLTGLLVFVCDKPALTRFLIGLAAGMFYDAFVAGTVLINMVLFGLLAFVSGLFGVMLRPTGRKAAWIVFLVFVSDALPFAIGQARGIETVSWGFWLYHMELLTLIFSALIVIGILYVDMVMSRYYLFQSRYTGAGRIRSYAPHVRAANRNHPKQAEAKRSKRR